MRAARRHRRRTRPTVTYLKIGQTVVSANTVPMTYDLSDVKWTATALSSNQTMLHFPDAWGYTNNNVSLGVNTTATG